MRELKKLLTEWLDSMKKAHATAKRDLAEINRRMRAIDEAVKRNEQKRRH